MSHSQALRSRREFLGGAAAAALSACGAAPVPGPRNVSRPNILFLLSDQHRDDWVGRNPDVPVPTPHIDALAARGVDFTKAIVAAPVCGPSRSCLASGMEYENCGVEVNRDSYDPAITTHYKHLRDSGYYTTACGKIDLHKGPEGRTPDGRFHMEEWGFSDMSITGSKGGGLDTPYGVYLESADPKIRQMHLADIARRATPKDENWWGLTDITPLDDEHYKDNYTGRKGMELLEKAPEDKPWFLVVNFNNPHPPMDITARMERRYRGPDRVIDDFEQPHHYTGPFSPEHHIRIRQNYAAMIENCDDWVGRYTEWLRKRGELDNTIFVYSSDHGEMLGDHDRWGKSIPYQASAGVPLVMAGPGIAEGVVTDAQVSLMDLASTFIECADRDAPAEMESRSLRGLIESGKGEHRDYVRSALKTGQAAEGRFRMVQDQRYKLVDGFFEEKTLFDREADPLETENVAESKPGEVARLEKLFAEV